jgi:hypothetical protein
MGSDATKFMTCPCCGGPCPIGDAQCSCGARSVGEPLSAPDRTLPHLGASFTAFGCAALVIVGFLLAWLLNNDMKVGRALLVTLLGSNTKLARDLLAVDPHLPLYRIFSYDALRLAFLLAALLIPFSCLGTWLSLRAARLARTMPEKFGGLRIAQISLVLSLVLGIAFSVAAIGSIPQAIERRREKQAAGTRALMYRLHYEALERYHREKGTYPPELSDLVLVTDQSLPQLDNWEHAFTYAPGSVIASKAGAVGFSTYKLVSAGPDGQFGTDDDIVMVDGVVVTGAIEPLENDLQSGPLPASPGDRTRR